jgi:hypothetical protein
MRRCRRGQRAKRSPRVRLRPSWDKLGDVSSLGRRVWVGRTRELERLEALLRGAAAGRGGSALCVGEAGIGKTRLLEEVSERARERGFATAWGRGWELGQAPSFWPWRELLRTLFDRPLAPLAPIRRLEPLLAEVAPGASSASTDDFRLFDSVLI